MLFKAIKLVNDYYCSKNFILFIFPYKISKNLDR